MFASSNMGVPLRHFELKLCVERKRRKSFWLFSSIIPNLEQTFIEIAKRNRLSAVRFFCRPDKPLTGLSYTSAY